MKKLSEYLEYLKLDENRNSNKIKPVDKTNASEDEIIEYFRILVNSHHKSGLSTEDEFYGGITSIDGIKTNLCRHHIDSYLGCVRVKSYDIATKIECRLYSDLHVYIGKRGEKSAGNGGDDKSDVVYLADRRQKGFIEY